MFVTREERCIGVQGSNLARVEPRDIFWGGGEPVAEREAGTGGAGAGDEGRQSGEARSQWMDRDAAGGRDSTRREYVQHFELSVDLIIACSASSPSR